MTKKLIIFDFDGVLVTGTNEGYMRCYLEAMEFTGAINVAQEHYAKKKILENWGSKYDTEIGSVVKNSKKLKETDKKFIELIKTNEFVKTAKKTQYLNECLNFISKNNHIPTISSGSSQEILTHVSNFCNINLKNFKDIQTGDMYPEIYQKPNPKMIKDQMKKFNITPKNTFYIGDAKGDIQMAKAAKVTSVTVLTGLLNKTEAKKESPDFIINNLKELPEVLKCT